MFSNVAFIFNSRPYNSGEAQRDEKGWFEGRENPQHRDAAVVYVEEGRKLAEKGKVVAAMEGDWEYLRVRAFGLEQEARAMPRVGWCSFTPGSSRVHPGFSA